jgi:mRNA interferase MazF
MQRSEIVLVLFPFTDLSGSKKRPALVLTTREEDLLVAFITSKYQTLDLTDILLHPTDRNGLKKPSIIRTHKLVTLSNRVVFGQLGAITQQQQKEVDQKLMHLLQLK